MSAHGQHIHAQLLDVHGDGTHSLNRIGVHPDAVLVGDLSDLLDGLDGADLVVGHHDADQRGIGTDGSFHVLGADVALEAAVMVGAQDLDDAGLAAAVAVGSLGEVAVGEVMDVADVSESDAVAVLADDLGNIVVGVGVQAAGAQSQAVVRIIHHGQEAVDALGVHQQAGQAEDIPWGIVHMDGHLDVALAAGGHEGFQEVLQILHSFSLVTGA